MIQKSSAEWLDAIRWNSEGLVPVTAQDNETGRVLTQAWMNREALATTVQLGQAVYWSRTRQQLWHKGESSGHYQEISEIRIDCDMDSLLLQVRPIGGIACHTGRYSCFFTKLQDGRWVPVDAVIKDPEQIYGQDK